jgi:hypothetical protein
VNLKLVMAGHSRPKDGVASARLCPAIYVFLFLRAKDVDARDKPGHDVVFSDRVCGRWLRLARNRLAKRGLRGGKTRDRPAIGRARHVVEADLVAERD